MIPLIIVGNAKPLNVSIVEVFQNSVTLRMKRIVWNDPRQILPAIISYGRRYVVTIMVSTLAIIF